MKTAIIILSDPKGESEESLGRVFNGLAAAYDYKSAGKEVSILFQGAGTRWPEVLQKENHPAIENENTVVVSPHKVYGPETNDLVLQLRKRGIGRVVLAGMSANLCVESHMRELLEQGFEVAVVKDATAAAIVPEGNGYDAAVTNFRFLANTVWSTEEAVGAISQQETVATASK